MAEFLKGGPAAAGLIEDIRKKLNGEKAKLVLVGIDADPSLISYSKSIEKTAKEAGIEFEMRLFPADVSEDVFVEAVEAANADPRVDGVLLSMPLPERIAFERLQAVMRPEKDVDGISLINRALLYEGKPCFYPCTAEAVLRFLAFYGINVSGKNAVVVGRSPVVGRPVAMGLLARDATVTVCHTKTADLAAVTRGAEILVTATGVPELITGDMIAEGTVVIDLGMAMGKDGRMVGDVEMESVSEKASLIAPAFGGVGILTTVILLEHTLRAHFQSKEEK